MATTNIPQDIISLILLDLPPKSLVRFKCVCKPWKTYIESSDFIQLHLNRSLRNTSNSSLILTCGSSLHIVHDLDNSLSSTRPTKLALPRSFQHNSETIRVVGSCNGLLCVGSGRGLNHFFLCNPSNPRAFKVLPYAANSLSEDDMWWCITPKTNIVSGFGYDRLSDDYKVVYFWYRKWSMFSDFEGLVYSSRESRWKPIETPPFKGEWSTHGVHVNNGLHWRVFKDKNVKIVRFDLHDEEWGEVSFPNECEYEYRVKDVRVLGGCLSILMGQNGYEPELWVMKEYGVNESWTKVCSVPIGTRVLFHSIRRGRALLLKDDGTINDPSSCSLVWYSLREKRVIDEDDISGDLRFCAIHIYVESLIPVLPKKLGQQHRSDDTMGIVKALQC